MNPGARAAPSRAGPPPGPEARGFRAAAAQHLQQSSRLSRAPGQGYAGEGPRIREGKEQMLGRFLPFLRFELQGQMGQIQLPAGRPQCPRAVGAGRGLGAGVPGPAASSTGMTPALLRAVVAALESLSGSGSYLLLVSEGRARVVLSREGVIAASWGGL